MYVFIYLPIHVYKYEEQFICAGVYVWACMDVIENVILYILLTFAYKRPFISQCIYIYLLKDKFLTC